MDYFLRAGFDYSDLDLAGARLCSGGRAALQSNYAKRTHPFRVLSTSYISCWRQRRSSSQIFFDKIILLLGLHFHDAPKKGLHHADWWWSSYGDKFCYI